MISTMMNHPRKVQIAFNIHPLWLKGTDLGSFLAPLREAGLNSLEFEIDSNLPEWNQVVLLIADCSAAGMEICFHAPYRPPVSLRGFHGEKREAIIETIQPVWSLANKWALRNQFRTAIVIHGAVTDQVSYIRNGVMTDELEDQGQSPGQQVLYSLREDTKDFIIWALDRFPNLVIALENLDLANPGVIKFGERREDVLDLVKEINHPRLGICWDLGHDIRQGVMHDPPREWLEHVKHVHAHDIDDEGRDHFPLIFGKVPNERWIQMLVNAGMEGTITLELKGQNMMGWDLSRITDALVGSIRSIYKVVNQDG